MRANTRLGLASLVLLALAACDPNPNGPSAPSAPAPAPGSPPAGKPSKDHPLKQVGPPIGFLGAPAGRGTRS
jgi:hypothetical protein